MSVYDKSIQRVVVPLYIVFRLQVIHASVHMLENVKVGGNILLKVAHKNIQIYADNGFPPPQKTAN